jgi:hypothetical protein
MSAPHKWYQQLSTPADDAHEAGRRAALRGLPRSANPYRPTSPKFSEWDRGWVSATLEGE